MVWKCANLLTVNGTKVLASHLLQSSILWREQHNSHRGRTRAELCSDCVRWHDHSEYTAGVQSVLVPNECTVL